MSEKIKFCQEDIDRLRVGLSEYTPRTKEYNRARAVRDSSLKRMRVFAEEIGFDVVPIVKKNLVTAGQLRDMHGSKLERTLTAIANGDSVMGTIR